MIICPHCARENQDDFKYCLGCGSQLPRPAAVAPPPVAEPKMIHCPHCSSLVPSNFKFCGACGGAIASLVGAGSQAQVPEPLSSPPLSSPPLLKPSSSSVPSQPQRPLSTPGFLPERTSQQVQTQDLGSSTPPSLLGAGSSAQAKLVVIRPDGTEGATIPMSGGTLVIGRSSAHEVLAEDPFLSPEHASLHVQDGVFTIKDLNSLNGIFYRIRTESELHNGDHIRLGQELLEFHFMESDDVLLDQEHADTSTLRGGSPDIGYWCRLSLLIGPGIVSRAFAFEDDEINIGRERGDVLFRDDGFVSGLHARVLKSNDKALLKDMGSSNGTYIRIRQTRELVDGDLILMGQQLFRLVA